jgi:hypothetical protein
MVGVLKNVLAYGLVFGLGTAGVIWARVAALRPDPEAERVLNSPGVIERVLAQARDDSADAGTGKPPLVAAAEAFALYLNPPEPPAAKRPPPRQRAAPPKPAPVTSMPRFRLLGISYHRAKPAESRALLWAPDGTQQWVRQGAAIGHLTVETIKGTSITYRDGGGTHEMRIDSAPAPTVPVQRSPDRSRPELPDDHRTGVAMAEPPGQPVEGPPRTVIGGRRPRPRRAAAAAE